MIAADSSVVVAAFATWHEFHEAARRALDRGVRLPTHAALEAFSVLTRLPQPHRASPSTVRSFLEEEFREPYLHLSPDSGGRLIAELVEANLTGGAVYDGLIAVVARDAGARLLTFDARALRTYERLRADAEYLAPAS